VVTHAHNYALGIAKIYNLANMEMTEDQGKIVIYKKFDSVIEANLAKTKLDAYGIPCFLTNENIASLYPLPHMKGMEVNLHIFKEDEPRASEILSSEE
jgi:hypothetical protein